MAAASMVLYLAATRDTMSSVWYGKQKEVNPKTSTI
jgi:hypothetical protein